MPNCVRPCGIDRRRGGWRTVSPSRNWRRGTSGIGKQLCDAYPKVSKNIPNRAKYRDPDAIRNTWEAFEGILKRSGYFTTGLRKVEAARAVGALADPMRNRSQSFVRLRDTLVEALGERRQEGSPP